MKQSHAKAIQLDDLRLQQYLYKKLKFLFTKIKKKKKINYIYINSERKKKNYQLFRRRRLLEKL